MLQVVGQLWVAAGQWSTNEVLFLRWGSDAVSCSVVVPVGQPRSLCTARWGKQAYLFVGTSTGALLWYFFKVR